MACLPSLIGMRGRCAVVEEQDCWLLVVTRCVAGRVALTRQAVVVGLCPGDSTGVLMSPAINTVPFCCSQLGTASAAKSNHPHRPPTSHRQTFGSRSEARRARAARRGGAEAGALHPARGRHRLAPQLTALRPLRRRTTGVAQKATPGVGCSLDPSPAAPSPGRLTAHSAARRRRRASRAATHAPCPDARALQRRRARVPGTDGAAAAPAVAAPPPRRARRARAAAAAAAAAPSSPSSPPYPLLRAPRSRAARPRPRTRYQAPLPRWVCVESGTNREVAEAAVCDTYCGT